MELIHDIVSAYQPVVALDSGHAVGFEALARSGDGGFPADLFAAAYATGRVRELDAACRAAAVDGATAAGLRHPHSLFVNTEPIGLDDRTADDLIALAGTMLPSFGLVLEITERALTGRPGEMLRAIDRIRAHGWRIAMDDVGADPASLALLPVLRPDVIKLDLQLVQGRPTSTVARTVNAVNAHVERSGASLLAEGIEDDHHLAMAEAMGATLGQGWGLGPPALLPSATRPPAALEVAAWRPRRSARSPFDFLPDGMQTRRGTKALLVQISRWLEQQALALGDTGLVVSAFQDAAHVTPSTRIDYERLARELGLVCVLGENMSSIASTDMHVADLGADDPVRDEWDVVVVGPHFAAALLARDLHVPADEPDRVFEFALTYDRDAVAEAARALLLRMAPPGVPEGAPGPADAAGGRAVPGGTGTIRV